MEKKVLLISGRPPKHSAGYVNDTLMLLELAGYKVDFLTLYPFDGQTPNQYNVLEKPLKLKIVELIIKHPWIRFFRIIYHILYLIVFKLFTKQKSLIHGNYLLVFEKEEEPPIAPSIIFEKIKESYDYFVVMIVQDMITSNTIKLLYEKYQKPVILMSPDMYHFTGNCFFPNNCENYLNECRDCPAYKEMGLKDSAHNNFIYKKKVYNDIRCAFPCNTYVANIVRESKIIPNNKLFLSTFILDTDVFKPYDKRISRNRFNIPDDKSFVIMARYIGPHNLDWNRKGGQYLIETLDLLYKKMTNEEKKETILIFAGTDKLDEVFNIKFDTLCLGNLSKKDLIYAYNASSVFFCPSINDSGPSMVNQSMACATPVVAFNQGTAIDVIENGHTGFKAELFDTNTLANALLSIMRMDENQYQELKICVRKKAIESNSFDAGVKQLKKIFESFEKGSL